MKKKTKRVLAVAISDVHLSHTPPVMRSSEPCWYAAQQRVLRQVCKLCTEGDAPLIIAGDVFDRWNSCAQLIHCANEEFSRFPKGVCMIPGQHDLPQHRYADRHRSAYGVLAQNKNVLDMDLGQGGEPVYEPPVPFVLAAFPWGRELKGTSDENSIAVVHKYCWMKGFNHGGALSSKERFNRHRKSLKGYRVAVFGDNHKGFSSWSNIGDETAIVNCGTLMRRHADEAEYQPKAWLIYEDFSIDTVEWDVSKDVLISTTDSERTILEMSGVEQFIEELSNLGDSSIDFVSAVKEVLKHKKVKERVAKIVLKSIELSMGN